MTAGALAAVMAVGPGEALTGPGRAGIAAAARAVLPPEIPPHLRRKGER